MVKFESIAPPENPIVGHIEDPFLGRVFFDGKAPS